MSDSTMDDVIAMWGEESDGQQREVIVRAAVGDDDYRVEFYVDGAGQFLTGVHTYGTLWQLTTALQEHSPFAQWDCTPLLTEVARADG